MNENTPVSEVLEATIRLYTKSKKKPGPSVLYNRADDAYCVLGAISAVVTNKEELETNYKYSSLSYPTKKFKNLRLIRKTAKFLWETLREQLQERRGWSYILGDRFSWKAVYRWNDELLGAGWDLVTGERLPEQDRRKRFLRLLRTAQKKAKAQGV